MSGRKPHRHSPHTASRISHLANEKVRHDEPDPAAIIGTSSGKQRFRLDNKRQFKETQARKKEATQCPRVAMIGALAAHDREPLPPSCSFY